MTNEDLGRFDQKKSTEYEYKFVFYYLLVFLFK